MHQNVVFSGNRCQLGDLYVQDVFIDLKQHRFSLRISTLEGEFAFSYGEVPGGTIVPHYNAALGGENRSTI